MRRNKCCLLYTSGRANANILSDITVDYYGVATPVTQVAAVKTPEAHMLLIEPWDKALINAIVKAISASDLGITPNSDGTVVRLPFPAPTEERRRELVKECREYAEQAKVSIRNKMCIRDRVIPAPAGFWAIAKCRVVVPRRWSSAIGASCAVLWLIVST